MLAKIAVGNVRRSVRDFSIFFATLAISVCIFYAFGSLKDQTAVIKLSTDERAITATLLTIFDGVSIFVAVILGFLVVYANRFLIRRRKREFGVYLTLGMSRAQVGLIIVMETLLVGIAALIAGLVAGVLVSQLMLYVTARLFKTTVEGFTFLFSPSSCATTAACFGVIFLVSLIFDVTLVSKYKLIDLMRAEKTSEKVKLRSIPVSIACFIASLALIGVAYYLLVRSGMTELGADFAWATILVCMGTALLFFSVSGFLLAAARANKGFYLRGLNLFVARQLNSRVNTAWVSITMVCAMLFLAICSLCTGFAMARALNSLIDHGISYDVSLMGHSIDEYSVELAEQNDYDALSALRQGVEGWDQMVGGAAQLRQYYAQTADGSLTLTLGDLWHDTGYTSSNKLVNTIFSTANNPMTLVKLSDYNDLRRLLGKEPVELGDDEVRVWSDHPLFDDFWRAFREQHKTLDLLGRDLSISAEKGDEAMYNYLGYSSMSTLVVPDAVIDDLGLKPQFTCVNVSFAGSREDTSARFSQAVTNYVGTLKKDGEEIYSSWPVYTVYDARDLTNECSGMSATMSYLAVYIGFVLVISCASVLALQQLSEASDNAGRYRVLAQLGAEPGMVRRALAAQIGIYFLFPLVVALCHAACALYVINDLLISMCGYVVYDAILISAAFLVVLYGGYFLLTYKTSKDTILSLA